MNRSNYDAVTQQAIDALHSFEGDGLKLRSAQRLQGGQSGIAVFLLSYSIDTEERNVVARVLKLTDSALREFICAKRASDIGISPKIVWPDVLDSNHLVVLSEYISGPNLTASDIVVYQEQLVQKLKVIHTKIASDGLNHAKNLFERINGLANLEKMQWFKTYFQSQVERLQKEMSHYQLGQLVVTHNDFNPGNFKFKDANCNDIMVFDWGNAGIGDAIADLADFTSLCGFNQTQSLMLLNRYLLRQANINEQAYFLIYKGISILRIAAAAIRDYHKYADEKDIFQATDVKLDFNDWYQQIRENKRQFPANKAEDWYLLANCALTTWHHYDKKLPFWFEQLG